MSKHKMPNMLDESGDYKSAETVGEAKASMKSISPEKTKRLLKAYRESIYIYGLAGIGLCGLIILIYDKTTGHKTDFLVAVPIILVSFGLSAIIALIRSRAAKKVNEEILSGQYFTGKSDSDIIDEANHTYINWLNEMKAIDKKAEEKAGEKR